MSPADKFAIEVHFLTGRYVATSHNDRRVGEWPPHPARLFSAMVAAWAEAEEPDPEERSALEWLEGLESPAIAASDAVPRRTVSHFVPVNDPSVVERGSREQRTARVYELSDRIHEALVASGGEVASAVGRLQERLAEERRIAKAKWRTGKEAEKAAAAMLPEGRWKQERAFPSMVPHEPHVTYVWTHRKAGASTATATLDRLLQRVTRLGHSSSLVSCRVVFAPSRSHLRGGRGWARDASSDRPTRTACGTRASVRAPPGPPSSGASVHRSALPSRPRGTD